MSFWEKNKSLKALIFLYQNKYLFKFAIKSKIRNLTINETSHFF